MEPAPFPLARPRRLRRNAALRAAVRETTLVPSHLVAPLFVKEGIEGPQPVASMPGVAQHTVESLRAEAKELRSAGVRTLLLFGVPARKDALGSEAYNPEGIVQRASGPCARTTATSSSSWPTPASTSTPTTATAVRCGTTARSTTTRRTRLRPHGGQPGRGRGRRRRPLRDDGRAGRRDPRGARRRRARRVRGDHELLHEVRLAPSTGRSATPPSARRPSATARRTRWIPATPRRGSARPSPTSPRARTCSS
jgi:hypothetical protein